MINFREFKRLKRKTSDQPYQLKFSFAWKPGNNEQHVSPRHRQWKDTFTKNKKWFMTNINSERLFYQNSF